MNFKQFLEESKKAQSQIATTICNENTDTNDKSVEDNKSDLDNDDGDND